MGMVVEGGYRVSLCVCVCVVAQSLALFFVYELLHAIGIISSMV